MLILTARPLGFAASHHRVCNRGVSSHAPAVWLTRFSKSLARASNLGRLHLQQQKPFTVHSSASTKPTHPKVPLTTSAHHKTGGLGSGGKIALGIALILAAGTASALFFTKGVSLRDAADAVTHTVDTYGSWGPVIFVTAFVTATLLLIPATALTLAAGFLFGPTKGTALVTLAATLGAAAAFLVSRYLAKDFAKAKLQSYPRLKAIEEQVSQEGVKIVLLLRLAPLVPFTVLNYALGVTDVSLLSYTVATVLGKLPGVLSQVYVGSTGRTVEAATSTSASSSASSISLALTVVGVLSSVLVTKVIADKAAAVLKEYEPESGSSTD